MSNMIRLSILASATLLSAALTADAQAQQANMSFFVTSAGSGKGADLGGSPARTSTASNSRKPPAPPARPGTPISAPRRRTASPRSMRAIVSAMVRGKTPRVW